MKTIAKASIASISCGLLLVTAVSGSEPARLGAHSAPPSEARPELEYLKAVNLRQPPRDPQVLFLLMAQFANANRHREGAEFFGARLREFDSRLSEGQKSLYLAAIGVLRAGAAGNVPLLKRIGWIRETIDILERAKRGSGGQIFVVRWMSGVVYAQLPGLFHQQKAAFEDLNWCLANADKAPGPGWLREVHYRLATLYRREGQMEKAKSSLKLSGFPGFDRPVTFATEFFEDSATGHKFSSKRIAEIVPGKVYVLSGYEFTEFYFVVSEDRRELIAIDAGTRPDSAQAAYEALRAYAPRLPDLTTVLVTHSHWDHVGGHRYFRSLNPRLKIYARANYSEEITRSVNAPEPILRTFFGSRFRLEDVQSFRPDVTISERREIRIGGTRFEVIPIEGGETSDGLLFFLPDHGVMFVGDFIMPFLGAPFVEEGSLPGLLGAIDVVVRANPRYLLHGHEPLTRLFDSPHTLAAVKPHLEWLQSQVIAAVRRGEERAAIQQANLIPPGLVDGDPSAHLPYLVLRENVINRTYHQHVGYWQPDMQGVDYVSRADRGALLVDYLGVSEGQLVAATKRLIADGRYELAATALDWAKDRFPASQPIQEQKRLIYLKLMEKYQAFNPFKFILYSWKMDEQPTQPGLDRR
jgi:glyoxylase-like metal-dependent hydrolase (beta-lactamase superfamily II)